MNGCRERESYETKRMRKRVLIPELMDDPELAREDHFHALRGLRRINAWTGTASLLWRAIVQLAKTNDLKPLRILDLATGAGDIPIELCKRAAREHVDIDIEACDVSEQALEFAEEQCHRAGASVRLFQHDVIQRKLNSTYDVVMCSQFLHHLSKEQAEDVLRTMMEAAEHRVFVVDLVRSRFNWLQVWLATRSLTKSKIVHFDGPQSIRAAFTVREMECIAQDVGFSSFSIHKRWPVRFVLVGSTDGG